MMKIKDFTLASKNLGGRGPVPYSTPAQARTVHRGPGGARAPQTPRWGGGTGGGHRRRAAL